MPAFDLNETSALLTAPRNVRGLLLAVPDRCVATPHRTYDGTYEMHLVVQVLIKLSLADEQCLAALGARDSRLDLVVAACDHQRGWRGAPAVRPLPG